MSAFTAIDLSKLPAPSAVEVLDVEAILAQLKADVIARDPSLAEALSLESEPLVKLLEAASYRELLLRQRINEAVRATMLAFAGGADLDHLGSLFSIERAILVPADIDVLPPTLAIYESDDRFRNRIQLALEGFSTAGTLGGYRFFALSASGAIADVSILNPSPGIVRVVLLSRDGDGSASDDLLETVQRRLSAEEVRPLTDLVEVVSASVVPYFVSARLKIFGGPDPDVVVASALAAVEQFVSDNRQVGRSIPRAGLIAALFQSGVENVDLISPASDVVTEGDQAGFCADILIAVDQ
jgi:phage-related baseplate assembly protein